jgi:hypothetical protein
MKKMIADIFKKLIFYQKLDSRQYQNTGKFLLATNAMED